MTELEKDLERIDAEAAECLLDIYPGKYVQYIASRLAELGYVKVVRCGECKFRIPSKEAPLTKGFCQIDADCFGAVSNMSIGHFCGYGEPKDCSAGERVVAQNATGEEGK